MRGRRRSAIRRRSAMVTARSTEEDMSANYTHAMRSALAAILIAGMTGLTIHAAPSADVLKARAWRVAHERQIVAELMQLVALPNIASNKADIVKNADALTTMFEKRGFTVKRVATPGSPVVIAERSASSPRGTLTFYMHYDGQPTEAKEWTIGQPFAPVAMQSGARVD